ncbi:hypothetical protein [Tissierella creatinophila]|uniref:Uncharacterized protein n=1 Tax=Tissierella creatinophila DSM 6911 TaxID=1123403 RepID=A0A1U7M6W2_TISCR|nr:hypothetical protein [Tissierella creatinophila]OLS02949.1 hypothetical protein TICRE_10060 [Tissierella creatinophila DSM 6911]
MKNHQYLIGKIIIAIAIIISATLFSNALKAGFISIEYGLGRMGDSIRDGLIQQGTSEN